MEAIKLEQTQEENKIIPFYSDKNDIVPFIIEKLKQSNDNIKFFEDFHIYENGYWQKKGELYVKKLIQEFCVENGFEAKHFKLYKKVDDLFNQAKLDLYTEVNTNKNILNFQNGTYELDTMTFREHRKEDYLFYSLPYPYDATADCPKWKAFIKEVLPQEDLQIALQEAVAYPLSNLHLEKISYLVGRGRNGKSVALGVVCYVLGEENISHVTLEQIVKNDGKGVYQMLNKLVNITYESSSNILNTASFKSYVSGEDLSVKRLYDNEYTTTNYPQTIIASNSIPQSSDFSEGFYRRFNLIPFNETIPLEKVNPNLKEELCVEAAGIMNWILEGIIRLRENKKFSKCETIEKLQNEYRIESDNVYSFLDENNYTQSTKQKKLLSLLYKEFEDYCELNGYKTMGKKTFKQRLINLNYKIKYHTGNNLNIWIEKDTKLKDETYLCNKQNLFEDNDNSPF
jgi:putative DNA primase/helicase